MNHLTRRNLMFSVAATALLAASGSLSLTKTADAQPLLANVHYGPATLVGDELHQLNDVLLGYVRLDQVHTIYMPGHPTEWKVARWMTAVGMAAVTGTDWRHYRRMMTYMFDDGTLKMGETPFDPETRAAQQAAWRAAVMANGFTPCGTPQADEATLAAAI